MKNKIIIKIQNLFTVFLMLTMSTTIIAQPPTPFRVDGKWGYRDKAYQIVITPQYDNALPFSEEYAVVEMNKKFTFINLLGEEINDFIFDGANSFSDGLAAVKQGDWQTEKWGYINPSGEFVIPLQYHRAGPFKMGLAQVGIKPAGSFSPKFGFIDKNANVVVPLIYDETTWFYDGIANVRIGNKWGFINREGDEIAPVEYDYLGIINYGLLKARLNGKEGFIDRNGKEAVPMVYDLIDDFQTFEDGDGDEFHFLARVIKDGLHGLIDAEGKEVFTPQYNAIGTLRNPGFSDGLVPVMKNYKWGFINGKGEEVIPLIYHTVDRFIDGVAVVSFGKESFKIDKLGNRVSK